MRQQEIDIWSANLILVLFDDTSVNLFAVKGQRWKAAEVWLVRHAEARVRRAELCPNQSGARHRPFHAKHLASFGIRPQTWRSGSNGFPSVSLKRSGTSSITLGEQSSPDRDSNILVLLTRAKNLSIIVSQNLNESSSLGRYAAQPYFKRLMLQVAVPRLVSFNLLTTGDKQKVFEVVIRCRLVFGIACSVWDRVMPVEVSAESSSLTILILDRRRRNMNEDGSRTFVNSSLIESRSSWFSIFKQIIVFMCRSSEKMGNCWNGSRPASCSFLEQSLRALVDVADRVDIGLGHADLVAREEKKTIRTVGESDFGLDIVCIVCVHSQSQHSFKTAAKEIAALMLRIGPMTTPYVLDVRLTLLDRHRFRHPELIEGSLKIREATLQKQSSEGPSGRDCQKRKGYTVKRHCRDSTKYKIP
ncbi:hypothetical protein KCU87_g237, partial [Aureobasidium melanogenum]